MAKRLTIALFALVLVAVLPASATYYDINNTIINMGATVYLGEQQLNLSPAQAQFTTATETIGWWGWWVSPYQITHTSPIANVTLNTTPGGMAYSFNISPETFYPGNWYPVVGGVGDVSKGPLFNVTDPSLAIDIWDLNTGTIVTDGAAVQGDNLTFLINTNLQSALDPSSRAQDTVGVPSAGNIDIIVRNSTGGTYTSLLNGNAPLATSSIIEQNVTQPQWFWGTTGGAVPTTTNVNYAWDTGVTDASGQFVYPAGVYTIVARSRLNGMIDNYLTNYYGTLNSPYNGKTVSQPATVLIVPNRVSISASEEYVVRGNHFLITISGHPLSVYHLWVENTNSMDGTYNNQPPMIAPNQTGVLFDNPLTPGVFDPSVTNPFAQNGNYVWENGGGQNVYDNVAHGNMVTGPILGNGTFEYANVTLNGYSGTRTVEFMTTNWTRAQQYTIRAEEDFGGTTGYLSDEVNVTVQMTLSPTPTPTSSHHQARSSSYTYDNAGVSVYTGPAPTQVSSNPAPVPSPAVFHTLEPAVPTSTLPPLPTNTPRSGLDAVLTLGAIGLCGVMFLFRKNGN